MAVIVKQQIDEMRKWTADQLGLPADTALNMDAGVAVRYVSAGYPGGLQAFTKLHPDPGLTPEQKAAAKTHGLAFRSQA